MTCKNCFNYEICKRYEKLFHKYITGLIKADRDCKDFQDRSLWVKLPCKAGDTVYVIYDGYVTCAYVLAFYIDKDGGMFDLCIKTKEEYAVGFKKVIDKNYTFSDIFLTQEEAERALKDRSGE